jgi:hypothetical protein
MRIALVAPLALCLTLGVPASIRADSTCDAAYSQNLIRQGFAQIDARRWQNVHAIAEQLIAYTGNCNSNFKIQNPTAIYGLYFAGYSLHELGDDPHAEEAVAAGLRSLEQLKKQGGYTSLYDNVRPLFVDVQSRIAGGYQ